MSFVLTKDQAQILSSLSRGGNCWIAQEEMAALAALGLAESYDKCWQSGRLKYRATDAGRVEAKRRDNLKDAK